MANIESDIFVFLPIDRKNGYKTNLLNRYVFSNQFNYEIGLLRFIYSDVKTNTVYDPKISYYSFQEKKMIETEIAEKNYTTKQEFAENFNKTITYS